MKVSKQETRLWNKNFIKFMIAYESLYFGYFTMAFVIPLYILTKTGNPSAMAFAIAFAGMPRIFVGLISGVVADRYNKRKILFFGYIFTAICILIYLLTLDMLPVIPAATAIILILMAVDAFLMPSLEGSIPSLVPEGSMQKATSAISSISISSMIAAPLLAGFIFERHGITFVLITAASLYGVSTLFALLYKFPYTKQKHDHDLLHSVIPDMKSAITYTVKEDRTFLKIMIMFFFVGASIFPMFTVGFMAIAYAHVGISHSFLGTAMGIGQLGGVIGPIITYALGKRVHIGRARPFFFIAALAIASMGFALMYTTGHIQIILFVVLFFIIHLAFGAIGPIIWAYFGENSPPEMVGKIMSLVMTFMFLGYSIGEFLWGQLLAIFAQTPWIALFVIAGLSTLVSLFSKIKLEPNKK